MQRGFGAFLLLVSPVLAQDDNDVLLLQKSLAVETVDELPYGSGSGGGFEPMYELPYGSGSGGFGTKPPKEQRFAGTHQAPQAPRYGPPKGGTPALIQPYGSGSGGGSWYNEFPYGSGSGREGGEYHHPYGSGSWDASWYDEFPYGSGSGREGGEYHHPYGSGSWDASWYDKFPYGSGSGREGGEYHHPYGSGSLDASWYDEFPYGSGSGREGGEYYYYSPCDAVCSDEFEKKLEERCGHDDCEAEFAGIDNIPDARKKMEEIGSWLVTEGVSETDVFACGECHLAELDKHGPGYGYPTGHGTKPPKGSKKEKGDTPALIQHGSGSGDGSWFELDGYGSGGGGTKPPKGSKKEKGDTPALIQHGSGSGDGSWFELDGYGSGGGGTKPPKGSKK